jgi:hypothetical protein
MAAWLDSVGPLHTREDYEIAYTIPPEGWVADNCPVVGSDGANDGVGSKGADGIVDSHGVNNTVGSADGTDTVITGCDTVTPTDPSDPSRNFTTPPVVDAVAADAVKSGTYETETEITRAGLRRILGL